MKKCIENGGRKIIKRIFEMKKKSRQNLYRGQDSEVWCVDAPNDKLTYQFVSLTLIYFVFFSLFNFLFEFQMHIWSIKDNRFVCSILAQMSNMRFEWLEENKRQDRKVAKEKKSRKRRRKTISYQKYINDYLVDSLKLIKFCFISCSFFPLSLVLSCRRRRQCGKMILAFASK